MTNFVNAYSEAHHGGALRCEHVEGKGRALVASKAFDEGDTILVEAPLMTIYEQPGHAAFEALVELCRDSDFEHDVLWYWCALNSLTAAQLGNECGWTPLETAQQQRLLLLHQGIVERPSDAIVSIATLLVPSLPEPVELERCLQAWLHNGFEEAEEQRGCTIYFFSAFINHSCSPSAAWHQTSDNEFVLQARCRILAGDEVTHSYLSETDMLASTPMRLRKLNVSFSFTCTCQRCVGDDLSSGMLCMKCGKGCVFSGALGCQTDTSSASDEAKSVGNGIVFEGFASRQLAFVNSSCRTCGIEMDIEASQRFSSMERHLRRLIQNMDTQEFDMEKAKAVEDLLTDQFKQHFLANEMHERLAEFYSDCGEWDLEIVSLQKRCQFYATAYQGLCARHAWAFEKIADSFANRAIEEHDRLLEPSTGEHNENSMLGICEVNASVNLLQRAYSEYSQAFRILSLLYGNSFCRTVAVQSKICRVQDLLEKYSCGVVQGEEFLDLIPIETGEQDLELETTIDTCVELGPSLLDKLGVFSMKSAIQHPRLLEVQCKAKDNFDTVHRIYKQLQINGTLVHGGYREICCRDGDRFDVGYRMDEEPFKSLAREGSWCEVVKKILGEDMHLERCGMVVATGGNVGSGSDQEWHTDVGQLFEGGPNLPCHCLSVFIPLVNMSDDNGPTEFSLGTHMDAEEYPHGEVSMICEAGTAIIFDSRVLHRGTANHTTQDRPVLYFQYAKSWFQDPLNYRYEGMSRSIMDLEGNSPNKACRMC